jgi:spermidine synthase
VQLRVNTVEKCGEMKDKHNSWQARNLAAIRARLAPVAAKHDGTLFTEVAGSQFVVVTKSSQEARLWLMEQENGSTGVLQSEIALQEPLRLLEPYTQAMMLALLWNAAPERVYIAGLGGGRLPMVLHHYLPEVKIDCVDVEPCVAKVAQRFFGCKPDDRLCVQIRDGRSALVEAVQGYGVILIDVFLDNGYSPYSMATLEFFQLCEQKVRPDGVVVINLLATDEFIDVKVATLARVFPYVYVCLVEDENVVLYGSWRALPDAGERQIVAAELARNFGFEFPLEQWVTHLQAAAASLDDRAIFVDGKPPATYFDHLPGFATAIENATTTSPCPCGSGRTFGECHG